MNVVPIIAELDRLEVYAHFHNALLKMVMKDSSHLFSN
jgi:hypothetical protein